MAAPPPPPPPPPPPHGSQNTNTRSSGLPQGNYDIFVIPPHSAGSGFLYLPSLQPHRNSFLAGVVCTLAAVGIWTMVLPAVRHWASSTGGSTGIILLFIVGLVGWAWGKTQQENARSGAPRESTAEGGPNNDYASSHNPSASSNTSGGHTFTSGATPNWQRPPPTGAAAAGWEKAREETRKREEERRQKEEAEKKAKEAAEKERWDKARAREREQREREAREKVIAERLKREKEAKEKAAQANGAAKSYQKPTAQSFVGTEDEYSYRPYDKPKGPAKAASQSSFTSASSYTGSQSTARTTPPPSHRGPYVNKDPDKVSIKAVYAFTDLFPKPIAQLVVGMGKITEGLVLKMTTEGLFIDDDLRGIPQREWDVKAWTMKLVESGDLRGKHILRASVRDAENKKYIFILDESEAWKVAVGLQRLRRGSQVRSLGMSTLNVNEMTGILKTLGWM